jgi:hypothetical protein
MNTARCQEGLLGRVEVPRADERDVLGGNGARVDQHPQRHPPLVAARGGLGRVQIAVRIEPDDREPSHACAEALDHADMGTAAPAEDERSLREPTRQH